MSRLKEELQALWSVWSACKMEFQVFVFVCENFTSKITGSNRIILGTSSCHLLDNTSENNVLKNENILGKCLRFRAFSNIPVLFVITILCKIVIFSNILVRKRQIDVAWNLKAFWCIFLIAEYQIEVKDILKIFSSKPLCY